MSKKEIQLNQRVVEIIRTAIISNKDFHTAREIAEIAVIELMERGLLKGSDK